eukprot:329838_1
MEDICRGGFGICSGCWWWSSPGSHWIEQSNWLYKHKELVVKVKDILSPIKGEFDKYQPGHKSKNKSRIQSLFDGSVQMIIEQIYECEIMVNDLSLPIKPICLCGAVLVPTLNDECYVDEYSYVIRDICDLTAHHESERCVPLSTEEGGTTPRWLCQIYVLSVPESITQSLSGITQSLFNLCLRMVHTSPAKMPPHWNHYLHRSIIMKSLSSVRKMQTKELSNVH